MSYKPTLIEMDLAEKQNLESWARPSTMEQRYGFRARIILLAGEGMGTNAIAARSGQ